MITVDDLMLENKWEEEEEPTVKRYLDGSVQVLKNAGAYKENSDILPLVLSSMVAVMMEKRGQQNNFNNVSMFPLSLQGLINSMKYTPDTEPEKGDEDG